MPHDAQAEDQARKDDLSTAVLQGKLNRVDVVILSQH